jgi:DNA-binding transcriptional regulator YhcF (GntR family)
MAEHLGAKYNSVKAAYAKLSDEGLLMRRGRGSYSPNVPVILLHLMDRVEALEKGSK